MNHFHSDKLDIQINARRIYAITIYHLSALWLLAFYNGVM